MSNHKSIDIELLATNSSGKQKLYIEREDDKYWFTLTGMYEGKKIQIDFDTLDRGKLEEIDLAINLILEDY